MDIYDENSELLKALAHPVRLRIAEGLVLGRECNVGKMVDRLALPQSTVSQHLGILKRCGIIAARRDGVRVCYSLSDERIKSIVLALKK